MTVLWICLGALAWLTLGYIGSRVALYDLKLHNAKSIDGYVGPLFGLVAFGPIGFLAGILIGIGPMFKVLGKNHDFNRIANTLWKV